jgi:hypothetical protein
MKVAARCPAPAHSASHPCLCVRVCACVCVCVCERERERERERVVVVVVVTGLTSLFLLRKHFITENFNKKKSGEVKDSVFFPLLILHRKRAKPAPPLTLSLHPKASRLYKTFGFTPYPLSPRPPISTRKTEMVTQHTLCKAKRNTLIRGGVLLYTEKETQHTLCKAKRNTLIRGGVLLYTEIETQHTLCKQKK